MNPVPRVLGQIVRVDDARKLTDAGVRSVTRKGDGTKSRLLAWVSPFHVAMPALARPGTLLLGMTDNEGMVLIK